MAGNFEWLVETDVFNTTYIRCPKDDAKAYLYNDEDLHYFTNFTGKKNTALYWFFIPLFKIPIGFLTNSKVSDSVPLNMMFGGILKFIQDLIAPIFLFLKVNYQLTIKKSGDILSSDDIEMTAVISKKIFGKETENFQADIKIGQTGKIKIIIEFKEVKIKITCQNGLG